MLASSVSHTHPARDPLLQAFFAHPQIPGSDDDHATVQFQDLPLKAQRAVSEYLDDAANRALAPQLQAAFLTDLRIRARVAIDMLAHHISQRKLEQMLGLSQGYLSRLRAGASNPSPELIAHLAMLCQDPPTRLTELQNFWALPAEEWPPLPKPPSRMARSPHRNHPRKSKG